MASVIWLSIDPVRKKIDFYPKGIAQRIEKEYMERDIYIPSSCVLGSDFFNSTIHFHYTGSCYQTTPAMAMGRAGFKQPGYRSVKRVELEDDQTHIKILSKQVHGEWRISFDHNDSDHEFNEEIDRSAVLNLSENNLTDVSINTWKSDDLDSKELDKNVVVWQWCKGTPENNGDIFKLPNKWWIPYDFDNTNVIENAYHLNHNNTTIELPVIGSRDVIFQHNSCYAQQKTLDGTKVRFVRRVVKTVKELKEMFTNIDIPEIDISSLLDALPDGSIPPHFNCCILQDIMSDPVKTVDGFIYERDAIERWFQHKHTAPLTGLTLSSIVLEPCVDLKKQIDEFKASLVAT